MMSTRYAMGSRGARCGGILEGIEGRCSLFAGDVELNVVTSRHR